MYRTIYDIHVYVKFPYIKNLQYELAFI